MRIKTEYNKIKPYLTKDGSIIRELFHPDVHGNARQSLAEATVPVGHQTLPHKHMKSEEIYHILAGDGIMTMGTEVFPVSKGDSICISPGTRHWIKNTGNMPLKIMCCCAPAYSHDDTELLTDP